MKYEEARQQMIQTWGNLSSHWGINKTMGQIHALLMISPEAKTTDDLIAELGISRGSVSMSLRSLVEWGIVHKVFIAGNRKEYYIAEKDAWKLALQIARERKRRELNPLIQSLQTVQVIDESSEHAKEVAELEKVSAQLLDVAMQVDKILEIGIRSGGDSIVRKLINVLR